MKTNSRARATLRLRTFVYALALVGVVALEVGLGASMAARFGHYTQTKTQEVPSLVVGDSFGAWAFVR